MPRRPPAVQTGSLLRLAGHLAVVLGLGTGCTGSAQRTAGAPRQTAEYLYVWAQSIDPGRGAFLGVFDLDPASPNGGRLVRVVPADSQSRGAHHTEHELGPTGLLLANAFRSGHTFLYDLNDPAEPRLRSSFTHVGPFSRPHSFVRLPGGNVLTTLQRQSTGDPPGGLAELDPDGRPIRWASAATPDAEGATILPYSLAVLPGLDRIVTTSTDMSSDVGVHVQIWRLSDLTLLHTLRVPTAGAHPDHENHAGEHHRLPGEPRVLADGRTVMFATFTCGLYRITGLDGPDPRVAFSYGFPGGDCAVPVVIGNHWVQTVPALHALVALEISDPARPREVSRLVLGDHVFPHWLAADAAGRRLVTNSGNPSDPALYLVDFDPGTGTLRRATTFPVLDMRRVQWSDGQEVGAVPHGAVFGFPRRHP